MDAERRASYLIKCAAIVGLGIGIGGTGSILWGSHLHGEVHSEADRLYPPVSGQRSAANLQYAILKSQDNHADEFVGAGVGLFGGGFTLVVMGVVAESVLSSRKEESVEGAQNNIAPSGKVS